MAISELHIQEFMEIFYGSQHNFGQFTPGKPAEKGDKQEGDYQTVTNRLITIEQYRSHLEGRKGLGIIPVTETGMCKFSVIDVDIYNDELSMYTEAIERNGFPFVPFKSKSGGLHIFLFFKEDTPAAKAIDLMRRFSFILSIDSLVKQRKNSTVEVFPKQTSLKDQSKVGSFLNLPYFAAETTVRYAMRNGEPLSLSDAIMYIKDKKTTLSIANEFIDNLPFSDAPPCLQMVNILDPFERTGGRNNFLFSMGVYLKKKNEDFFEQALYEVNAGLRNGLEPKEVDATILSSLRRKDYSYKCKEAPCADFCHKKVCRNREYGIGKNEGYFSSVECGQLFQYRTSQPYYEWEVRLQGQEDFKKLRFRTEDEIIKQDAFLRLCMRELYELPSKLKQLEWFNKVNSALKEIKCITVDPDDDTSPMVLFKSMVVDYIKGRSMAQTVEQIASGRVYYVPDKKEYLFRTKDLMNYLFVIKQFKHFAPSEVHGILKEMKCTYRKANTETRGKQLRVCVIHEDELACVDTTEAFHPDFTKTEEKEDF